MAATLCAGLLTGCSSDNNSEQLDPADALTMNQLQYLGTHNSYHIQPRADLFALLLAFLGDDALAWGYTHVPLTQQFDSQGIRQIELDIFDDPNGGRYANHQGRTLFGESAASGIAALDAPGLKVFHIQEVDYETTCYTFVLCLQEIKSWSDSNPRHLPITVLLEPKDDIIPDPQDLNFAQPLPIGPEALDRIDQEIRSVFGNEQLILPDDIRGDFATLEMAVLTNGWPNLSVARGKILFALDNGGDIRDTYIEGHPSLAGRILFTDSAPGTPEAAFMKRNDPQSQPGDIEALVALGYLVRTRADANTVEARSGDTTRRDAAIASGAHFISTDYPAPNLELSDYQTRLPGGGVARCNPVNTGTCTAELLE